VLLLPLLLQAPLLLPLPLQLLLLPALLLLLPAPLLPPPLLHTSSSSTPTMKNSEAYLR
jgi:hypothetical protein